jgi:hypothetical protein
MNAAQQNSTLKWGRYKSLVDNNPCIIGFNLNCAVPNALLHYPIMGRILITRKNENPESPDKHMAEIIEKKKELYSTANNFPALFTGYIVTAEDAEFIFYCKEKIRWFSILRATQRTWENWHVRMGQIADENAEIFRELIKPDTTDRNIIRYFNEPF